jgi:hypothetical protein
VREFLEDVFLPRCQNADTGLANDSTFNKPVMGDLKKLEEVASLVSVIPKLHRPIRA